MSAHSDGTEPIGIARGSTRKPHADQGQLSTIQARSSGATAFEEAPHGAGIAWRTSPSRYSLSGGVPQERALTQTQEVSYFNLFWYEHKKN